MNDSSKALAAQEMPIRSDSDLISLLDQIDADWRTKNPGWFNMLSQLPPSTFPVSNAGLMVTINCPSDDYEPERTYCAIFRYKIVNGERTDPTLIEYEGTSFDPFDGTVFTDSLPGSGTWRYAARSMADFGNGAILFETEQSTDDIVV